MSRTPPFHRRQPFQLPLANLDGSALTVAQLNTQISNQLSTPFSSPPYSPFRSTDLKPPTPYGGPVTFAPRSSYGRAIRSAFSQLQRLLSKRIIWFVLVLLGLIWWWGNGGRQELEIMKVRSVGIKNGLFAPEITRNLQFFPASNPKIHYVGRWTATPNRLRKDGTFAGIYFDLVLRNSTTIYLSLHNQPKGTTQSRGATTSSNVSPTPSPEHLSFRPTSLTGRHTLPISLLARVDQEEYVLLPDSSALVGVRVGDLDPSFDHSVRIIAPGTDDNGLGVIEFEGIWVSKGGKLGIVEFSDLDHKIEEEDDLQAENANIGESHRVELNKFAGRHPGSSVEDNDADGYREEQTVEYTKLIEIVTDSPGSLTHNPNSTRKGGGDGLLAGVMSWEYLIGEMFGVDHATISVDGMCLIEDCMGGQGAPSSMSDVFFRSGPVSNPYFTHPWLFQSYIPSVLLLNLGTSDYASFTTHLSLYSNTTTTWDLVTRFEEAYVSLVKSIRALAYSTHPAMLRAQASHFSTPENAPSSIPIFVMRPLLGQMEHATQGAVKRLREDGDKAVYWLDTSGWLDVPTPVDPENLTPADDTEDFYLEVNSTNPASSRYRLTPRGNQRTAIFLHTHLCRFLATDETRDKCAFWEPEDYVGKVYMEKQNRFDLWVDDEKEKRLKNLFWGEGGGRA